MALGLNRIWVRFGLWIAATVLGTIAILTGGLWIFSEIQYNNFYRNLPPAVRIEVDQLRARDQGDSPRALEIYTQYWDSDPLWGERWSLVVGLTVCVPFSLAVGFWVSRRITQPLASMVEVSQRVSLGDLGARAVAGNVHGEMQQMVDSFNRMIDALARSQSERHAIAASISHELRTPLTVLQARLHAICDGVITANEREFQTLLAQVEHLGRLVGDLHTLSMADAGQLSLQVRRMDLSALTGEVLEQMAPQLIDKQFTVELDLPEDTDDGCADIRADEDRMRQIISNLIGNALRHSEAGHWLGVSLHSERDALQQDEVVLSISDGGAGLPPELMNDPFVRFAQQPGKRKREGSGLGLSIVKALVVLQGGKVSASPSTRGGTCFTLRFPKA